MSLTYKELQGKVKNTDEYAEVKIKDVSKDGLVLKANEHPSYESIVSCIDNIVELLRENEYNFALYPAIFASCIINTFTDLEIKDETGEVDIELVYALDSKYNIIQTLKEEGFNYIFDIEQNLWRQIDFDKQRYINYGANTFFYELSDILYLLQDKFLNMDTVNIPKMLSAVDKITEMNKVFNTDYDSNALKEVKDKKKKS